MWTSSKFLWGALPALLFAAGAQATAVRLEATGPTVVNGSTFNVRIAADIDSADEIIGFGFDLLASANLRLLGFTPGALFADDPLYLAPFSDADGIRGASAGNLLTGPPVSGLDVTLGLLLLQAIALGPATIDLTADDLSFNFTEGLIPLSASSGNFMPSTTPASLDVIGSSGGTAPEPGTLACACLALLALALARRRAADAGARLE